MEYIGNILSGLAGGLVGAIATFYSTRQAQRRHTDEKLDDLRKELRAESKANDAILEWYFSQFLELRSYLFGETELIEELHEAAYAEEHDDYLEFLLKSIAYQNFGIFDSAERPDFLDKDLIIEFSKIGDSELRGRILSFGISFSRNYETVARILYKFQRFLELRIDGSHRGQKIEDTIKHYIYIRALIISLIFHEIYDILEIIPWINPSIENDQRDREKRALTILSRLCKVVVIPDRLIDVSEDEMEKEKLDREFGERGATMLSKIFGKKQTQETTELAKTPSATKLKPRLSNLKKIDNLTDQLDKLAAQIPIHERRI